MGKPCGKTALASPCPEKVCWEYEDEYALAGWSAEIARAHAQELAPLTLEK